MPDVGSFLFQGAPPQPVPTGSDTSTAFPIWLTSALYNTLGMAGNLATQPYTPFPGPQIAKPSDQTQQAWRLAGQNVGQWNPYLQQAGALTAGAAAPLDPASIAGFLNPYQSYVTGAINRNLNENLLPSIQDRFVSAGQSRSPQEAELTSRALRDTNTSIGEAMAGGYQGAVNSLLQQRQLQGGLGAQMGQLGALSSNLGGYDVGQLAASGQGQDAVAQANINAAMQEFQRQQQWPYQNVGYLSDIIRGLPVQAAGSTQQTVGSTYAPPNYFNPSPANAFLGGALGGGALGLRRGGSVRGARALSARRVPLPPLARRGALGSLSRYRMSV